jgi:hypothetical protein
MYLLDSNVFISAKNAYHGMDFAPGFWDWVEAAHAGGLVYSVEAVKDELKDGEDELADWVKNGRLLSSKPSTRRLSTNSRSSLLGLLAVRSTPPPP